MAPDIQSSQEISPTTWILRIAIIVVFLSFCLVRGSVQEAQHLETIHKQAMQATFQPEYGHKLSPLSIHMASGATLTDVDLHKSWTLLVFSSVTCEACHNELQSLTSIHPQIKDKVRIITVLKDKPLFKSPEKLASEYKTKRPFPFEYAVDPDNELGKKIGISDKTPYCVLLDPNCRIRLAVRGNQPSGDRSTVLADALMAYFIGKSSQSVPITLWKTYKPLPDTPVTLQDGHRSSLGKLSQKAPLVVTFLTGNSTSEAIRIKTLRQFLPAENVQFLLIAPNRKYIPFDIQNTRILISTVKTKPLYNTCSAYNLHSGPVSLIFYKGRPVIGEYGEQPVEAHMFDPLLAYAVFLSSSDTALNINKSRLSENLSVFSGS